MATQDDIAKKLNISRTTVSRALKGKNISDETRMKVLEAVESMGYMQNTVATGLASKGKKTVYVFTVVTIDEGYAMHMIDGIKAVNKLWRDFNFNIEIVLTDINKEENQCKEQIRQFYDVIEHEKVNGIIFSALSKENMEIVEEECDKRKIPLMTLDMIYFNDKLCHVGPDYYELGKYSAAYISQLIMKKGNILTLSYDEGYEIGQQRMKGFLAKLEENPHIHVTNFELKGMRKELYWEILDKYLDNVKPVAIYSPYHVEYIAEYLEKNNIEVHKYVLIANGINENIEKYLFNGMINGIVSARPYYLGAVAANNFFKYFYRINEMIKGRIDVMVDIYIAENYQRYDKLF